ncbi:MULTISPECIES: hypothetical protein [Streptomyces]|uniref:Uncharacterized protein n=1 Tax=Streptomyces fradiae ATCC 10745 = DSM 40063 TaxID=1319510 RepID=A0ABQ6XPA8_STRFR|nr:MULTISPECIES: hypothetical protein [Streptomyces]KAF0647135.1 hypothetical protein K701_25445 [Streptomyces fradiae ATCC 10745 = DSM 40063]QEV12047.1 hypothetical protein CP974_08465 [Streptomyces fradiae ATCC 10745 = DSM 40063]
MKVYTDPLTAETIPDGTFGGARPYSRPRGTVTPRWTREEQAAHLQALADAIRAPHPRPRPASTDTPTT